MLNLRRHIHSYLTYVGASTRASFADLYAAEFWQLWLELRPNPNRQIFASGVLKTRYLIEIVVVELRPDRLEGFFDIAKVHHPARLLADWAFYGYAYHEGMAMQARAFMPVRDVRQAVSCLECELFVYFHGVTHDISSGNAQDKRYLSRGNGTVT